MSTVISIQSPTTTVFLFGETEDSIGALAHALDEQGVFSSLGGALKDLSRAGRGAASGQLATVAHGLLDLDLGDLVVGAWRKYADLTAAAKRTFANPDSSEVVELATHCITSTHRPSVELFVDDVHVATVRFELCVEFVVKGLVATVAHGHLIALHSGTCDVTGRLAAEGRELIKREAHLELPLLLRLGDGIPLLGGTEHPPAVSYMSVEPGG
jgi:hypothetical protein